MFFRGHSFLFCEEETGSNVLRVLNLKNGSTKGKFKGFPEDFDVKATSQVKNVFYVIIASRTCYLFRLDEILASDEKEIQFKHFPLPATALFEKPYVKGIIVCILDNKLALATYCEKHGVRIHSCSLNPVIESTERKHDPTWIHHPVFNALTQPPAFHKLQIRERISRRSRREFYKAGGHESHQ